MSEFPLPAGANQPAMEKTAASAGSPAQAAAMPPCQGLANKDSKTIRVALLAACSRPARGFANVIAALEFQFDGNLLGITFPHSYFEAYYRQNWQTLLENLAISVLGSHIQFAYGAMPGVMPYARPPFNADADAFANFLVNSQSALTIAAIRKACETDNPAPWLLVILCGPAGTGKSTLLTVCQTALAASLGTEATQFARGKFFQPALPPETFWSRRRVLIVDDSQHTPAAELAAYLDAGSRAGSGRRAFCAFTGAIADISKLDSRIASRFRAGLVFELPPADLAMRMAYAEKHTVGASFASRRQLLQLARFAPDIPALQGLLQKMEFYGRINGQTLSPEALAQLVLPEQAGHPADWQRIIDQVAEATRVKPADILSSSRKHEIVQARMAAMYLCRARLGLSFPEIGRLFGGRNHASVIYAIRKVEELRNVDKVMHNLLTKLEGSGAI